jgi:hypothetical protein
MFETLIGLLLLVAVIWAVFNIVQSNAPNLHKFLWILLVVLFPVIGLIIWFLIGPKTARA